MTRPPRQIGNGGLDRERDRLDRVADGAQDLADLAAQEDEGDDRNDRDEGEDQRIFGKTLAVLVAMDELHDAKIKRSHRRVTSFPQSSPMWRPPDGTGGLIGCQAGRMRSGAEAPRAPARPC